MARMTRRSSNVSEVPAVARSRLSRLAACILLCCVLPAAAAAADPAQAEVDALLQALARSGCEFYRNGEWHSAEEAYRHLARKYEEARLRQAARSAEEFIDVVASRSSVSGAPYLVRCPGLAAVPSAVWLRQLLAHQRQASRSAR